MPLDVREDVASGRACASAPPGRGPSCRAAQAPAARSAFLPHSEAPRVRQASPVSGRLRTAYCPPHWRKNTVFSSTRRGFFASLTGRREPCAAFSGAADLPQRTGSALRRAVRDAHAGPKLHERLRQLASFSRIFLISWPQRGFIRLFDGGPRDRCFVLRYAGEHAQHVPVDRRLRRVKADGRDRARRIIPRHRAAPGWQRSPAGTRRRAAS